MVVQPTDVVILDVLKANPQPLTIEDIARMATGFGWSQIFLSVDSLSRRGLIFLKRRGFDYVCGLRE